MDASGRDSWQSHVLDRRISALYEDTCEHDSINDLTHLTRTYLHVPSVERRPSMADFQAKRSCRQLPGPTFSRSRLHLSLQGGQSPCEIPMECSAKANLPARKAWLSLLHAPSGVMQLHVDNESAGLGRYKMHVFSISLLSQSLPFTAVSTSALIDTPR